MRIAKNYRNKAVKVISIEAHPENLKALCNNIRCNNLTTNNAINRAASDHRGVETIYERVDNRNRVRSDSYSISDRCTFGENSVFLWVKIRGHEIYRGIITKAAVLLYSFAGPFHPYNDGNKRTALMVMYWFLYLNGYTFGFPTDTETVLLDIAQDKVNRVSVMRGWIQRTSSRNGFYDMNDGAVIALFNNTRIPYGEDEFTLELKRDIS